MNGHVIQLFELLCQIEGEFPEALRKSILELRDEGAVIGRYPLDESVPVEQCRKWQVEAYVSTGEVSLWSKVKLAFDQADIAYAEGFSCCAEAVWHAFSACHKSLMDTGMMGPG